MIFFKFGKSFDNSSSFGHITLPEIFLIFKSSLFNFGDRFFLIFEFAPSAPIRISQVILEPSVKCTLISDSFSS